jgi:branched-chain amino acid transport system substrate-binding protein
VIGDNKSDKAEAASVAQGSSKKTGRSDHWFLGFRLSMAAGNIVRDKKFRLWVLRAPIPGEKGNDYYFRVCFIDPFQGTVMANYAYQKLGARKAAIIQEVTNDYAVGLASFFKEAFVKLTGDPNAVVEVSNYQTNDQDFSAQLTNIKSKNVDVVFAPGNFTESALIVKQAKQLGFTIPFIGGVTWETDEFLKIGGADVEGAVFSTFFASKRR